MVASILDRLFPGKTSRMLDSCLEAILQDGASLEAALARYPKHAGRLRPLLEDELTSISWKFITCC